MSLELCHRIRDSTQKSGKKNVREKKKQHKKTIQQGKQQQQQQKRTDEEIQRHPYSFIYFKFDAWALTAFMNHLNKSTIQTKQ